MTTIEYLRKFGTSAGPTIEVALNREENTDGDTRIPHEAYIIDRGVLARFGHAGTYSAGPCAGGCEGPVARGVPADRKSTRLNSSHLKLSRMPSSA